MNRYERKKLNIKRLLTLGVPDIRGYAARNETADADEYFERVERFIESAPELIEILINASKLEENTRALKELEARLGVGERAVDVTRDTGTLDDLQSLKHILSEIGYAELNGGIDAVCHELKNGNLQAVEKLASEAAVKLGALYDSMKGAYAVKRFSGAKPGEDESAGGISLNEALELLDYEEANRKLRILAVDDVTVVLNTLTSVLSPHYEVFALKNSSQIEKFLTHTTPELFLLDIEMNEISGFDLVPIIRKHERHKDTPIIFLTGNASLNNLKDAVALGACDFITKPIDREILLEKIAKSIVRKRAY